MISKIDKNGNSYGKTNITIIDKYGKTKVLSTPTVWGSITGTLSLQTDLQSALNAKQDTLISGTNIKTINGNSVLGSGNLVISTASTITVGTTPVTSGTDGRVFFQSGGVVQQDSSFFWDNTNKRLGVGTATPSHRLHVDSGNTGTLNDYTGIFLSEYSRINFGGGAGQWIRGWSNRITFGNLTTEWLRFQSGNVGIGTTSPQARLDVRAQGALSTDIILRTRNSADTRNFLVVNGAGDVFNNGAGGVTSNTFYGENVGRSASGVNNTFVGNQAGRDNTTATNNTSFGNQSLRNVTTGSANSSFGSFALVTNNGSGNSAFGVQSLTSNTTGGNNVAYGSNSLRDNSTASNNSAFGVSSCERNTTGANNAALGLGSFRYNTIGSQVVAVGYNAGAFISGGTNLTIANNSVFLGTDTRANADSETNQIVIGYQAIGTGSNSVTLGNTSITQTNLRGQVVISGFASAPTGVEGAIYYDSTTKKHYGFDGTNWNALY